MLVRFYTGIYVCAWYSNFREGGRAHSGQQKISRIVAEFHRFTLSLVEAAVYDTGHSVAGCIFEPGMQSRLAQSYLSPSWKKVQMVDSGPHVDAVTR